MTTAKTVMAVVAEKAMAVVTITIVTKTGTMTTGFAPPPPAPTVPPPPQWTHLSRPNPTLLGGGGYTRRVTAAAASRLRLDVGSANAQGADAMAGAVVEIDTLIPLLIYC